MTTQETYYAGDPVIHLQTRKLLGTLRKSFTFDHCLPEAVIRVPPREALLTMSRAPYDGLAPVNDLWHTAWLKPAFHTEGLRVLWLSTDADPSLFARAVYHPAGTTSDDEIIKVGDAARVVLDHMAGTGRFVGPFEDTRRILQHFTQRADSYRKHLEEKG